MWDTEVYAISDLKSLCFKQILLETTTPHDAMLMIKNLLVKSTPGDIVVIRKIP